jgi:hypothetical protein
MGKCVCACVRVCARVFVCNQYCPASSCGLVRTELRPSPRKTDRSAGTHSPYAYAGTQHALPCNLLPPAVPRLLVICGRDMLRRMHAVNHGLCSRGATAPPAAPPVKAFACRRDPRPVPGTHPARADSCENGHGEGYVVYLDN